MTQPAKAQEPSMEDILASIRRIIADDDAASPPPKPPDPPIPSFSSPRKGEGRLAPPGPPAPSQPRAGQLVVAPAEPAAVQEETANNDPDRAKSPEPTTKTENQILELTEPPSAPQRVDKTTRIDRTEMGFAHPIDDAPEVNAARPDLPRPLLSAATTTAVNSAFNVLAQTVLVQNARTLDDLVKEMLRPLLKGWLDDNLPGLVERLVRTEIERVSRGRS